MISHIPKDQRKQYPCKFCGKMFDYKSSLQNHVKATHSTEDYVCHVCGKMFKNIFVFKQHAKTHDPSYVPYYKTRKNFISQKSKPTRMLKRRKSPNRICPYCSKEFPTKKLLLSTWRRSTMAYTNVHTAIIQTQNSNST